MKNLKFIILIITTFLFSTNNVVAQSKSILTQAWCDFETYDGGDDKDNDTRIELSYSVTYPNGITRVFAYTPKNAFGRFPDGSSIKVEMQIQGSPTIDDILNNPGKFILKFEPKGDDTWRFHYVIRMKFSDGTLLDIKSGTYKELTEQKRELRE